MSVIAFTPARFTPDDIAHFNAVALPRLESGLWGGIRRHTAPHHDELAVMMPGTGDVLFTFERDHTGTYALYLHGTEGAQQISMGQSLTECLAVWLVRERKAAMFRR